MATFEIMVRMASEFQTLAGQPNDLKEWQESYTSLLRSRRNWILEEMEELRDATAKEDSVEKLDALVDICYFIAGHFAAFGKILASNNVKIPGFNWVNSVTDLCPPDEIEPGLTGLLKFTTQITDLLQTVHFLARSNSLPLASGYELVHENNMTKIPSTAEEAELTVQKYLADGVAVQVFPFEYNSVTYYPVRIAEGCPMAGKLMKAYSYKPVDLSPAFRRNFVASDC